jgi:hypothetical protein
MDGASSPSATLGSASFRSATRTGFRRDLTGTRVRVAGELRPVVGTISMDAFAVELDRELPIGTPVVLIGRGMLAEDHARVAETITYEPRRGISSDPARAGALSSMAEDRSLEPQAHRGAPGRAGRRAGKAGAFVRSAVRQRDGGRRRLRCGRARTRTGAARA